MFVAASNKSNFYSIEPARIQVVSIAGCWIKPRISHHVWQQCKWLQVTLRATEMMLDITFILTWQIKNRKWTILHLDYNTVLASCFGDHKYHIIKLTRSWLNSSFWKCPRPFTRYISDIDCIWRCTCRICRKGTSWRVRVWMMT